MGKKKEQEAELNEEQITQENSHKDCITPEQLEDITNTLKRLQAEFENYKKRQEKENVQLIKNSNAALIKNILSVLDSFELALKENNTENPEVQKYRKGLEMIYNQLFSVLKEQGLRIIETKDKQFDPYKHEVMLVKETEKEDDTIIQEFQKGYMLNDLVLRHSKVMLSKKNDDCCEKEGK